MGLVSLRRFLIRFINTRDIQQLQQQQMQQFMQMNANMMQQHQQQTLALMELMKKFAGKWCWSISARGHLNAQRVHIFINLNIFKEVKN